MTEQVERLERLVENLRRDIRDVKDKKRVALEEAEGQLRSLASALGYADEELPTLPDLVRVLKRSTLRQLRDDVKAAEKARRMAEAKVRAVLARNAELEATVERLSRVNAEVRLTHRRERAGAILRGDVIA